MPWFQVNTGWGDFLVFHDSRFTEVGGFFLPLYYSYALRGLHLSLHGER